MSELPSSQTFESLIHALQNDDAKSWADARTSTALTNPEQNELQNSKFGTEKEMATTIDLLDTSYRLVKDIRDSSSRNPIFAAIALSSGNSLSESELAYVKSLNGSQLTDFMKEFNNVSNARLDALAQRTLDERIPIGIPIYLFTSLLHGKDFNDIKKKIKAQLDGATIPIYTGLERAAKSNNGFGVYLPSFEEKTVFGMECPPAQNYGTFKTYEHRDALRDGILESTHPTLMAGNMIATIA